MKKRITDIISIDSSLAIPVYKQIVQSIHRSIEQGVLSQNDILPSVNSISETFSMARGSVFTAYNDLRASGIIDSVPGKGYFVTSTRVNQKKRIFLLFSNLSGCEPALYNNLFSNLPEGCTIDIYFHHNDIRLFETVINEQADRYNVFIIVPCIHNNTIPILSRLENKQVFLLDNGYKEYRKLFKGVFRNPEKIINDILIHFKDRVYNYKRICLVPPSSGSKDFISGFNRFIKKFSLNSGILYNKEFGKIKKGDGIIVIDDKDLVDVVSYANSIGYMPGNDIGILSWSENILKTVIHNGITTAETDCAAMGQAMISMIFSGNKEVIESPVIITDRNSF